MTGDLVVLAADKDIEFALRGLLSRPHALGIRDLSGAEFFTHSSHDPGVNKNGPEFVRPLALNFRHALLVLDAAWAGAPQAREIEHRLDQRLAPVWDGRGRAVCIDPEVEVWVWSDSPHVAKHLGWTSTSELRVWLEARQLWPRGSVKPTDPKRAFRAVLQESRIPSSPAIFRNLGASVGVNRCQDASFGRLTGILRSWFGAEPRSRGS